MSNKQLRNTFRMGHLAQGALIIAYIYSPTLQASDVYSAMIKFVIVPAIIISGLLLWQQARVNKWRKKIFSRNVDIAHIDT